MYQIHVDGNLLFSTAEAHDKEEYLLLSPKLSLDINSSGSLSFVLPPCNRMYDSIRKMKSIITVKQDNVLLFRGRVLDDERDFYGQKNVYCEGDKSFLLDSLWEEQTFEGKAQAFFRSLITNHNNQVDAEKKFTVGRITAVDSAEDFELEAQEGTRRFWDTSTVIDERLMAVYGGYLRTRTEGSTTYIDWLAELEDECAQPISFSVNMLDLTDRMDAGDVFTCLIPLGHSEIGEDGKYKDPVTIASVNGGKEYIQDDAAVAKYGKIWRTKTWSQTKEPSALLEKAREYMETGAELRTLTLKAVDMHFTDGSIDILREGRKVHIESDPHGINLDKVCARADLDLQDPENNTYTFGEPPRTLSEGIIRQEREMNNVRGGGGRGGGSVQQDMSDILRWARIVVDEAQAKISLMAGEEYRNIEEGIYSLKQAGIDIDGAQAKISLMAGVEYEDIKNGIYTLSQAGIDIDGAKGKITLLAGVEEYDDIDGTQSIKQAFINIDAANTQIEMRVKEDEIISCINMTPETITIKASKVNLEGYVTASHLAAELAELNLALTDSITTRTLNVTGATSTNSLYADSASIGSLRIDGHSISRESKTVVTSASLEVTSTGGTVTGVNLNKSSGTIYYLDWS